MEESTQELDKDVVELGGNIELAGFRGIDGGTMIILKKIIGNYVRQFSEKNKDFKKMKLTLKGVHETGSSKKFDINAMVIVGSKQYHAEIIDRNIFTTVDNALKKIEASLG